MFKSDNSINVLIGKSISRTGSVQISDSTASTYIADGEIVVLDSGDNALVAGQTISDSEVISIVQGRGTSNPVQKSMKVTGRNVRKYSGKSYVAPQEQISYIGYNSSSGNITATSLNKYILRLYFKYDKEMWSQQVFQRYYEYDSDSSATSLEVAENFVEKLIGDTAVSTDVKAEMVTDGTFTVLGGASTLAVTNGSATATASAAGHNLVADDLVRIGGTGASTPVYRVASVSGTTITLAWAYQGTTATVANANVGEMSVVTSYGIKLTGKAFTFTIPYAGLFRYQKVAFDLSIKNFGTTAITLSQEAGRGNGTAEEVAELEWFAQGFDGIRNRSSHPIPSGAQDAVASTNYDTIIIEHFNNEDVGVVSGNKPSPSLIYIFIVDGAAQTTNVLAQLNPYMASTPIAFSAVAV